MLCLCRYTTSPHLFSGEAVEAFARVRDKVCMMMKIVVYSQYFSQFNVNIKDIFSHFLVKHQKLIDVLFGLH